MFADMKLKKINNIEMLRRTELIVSLGTNCVMLCRYNNSGALFSIL